MQEQKNVVDCYDKTAKNYADKFIDELSSKHLDRILLKSFASENSKTGKAIDLGCGPGQTTKFLSECGLIDILGVDISPQMISVAKSLNPKLNFETADILKLQFPNDFFSAAIAFYSIVHFDSEQLELAFNEVKRVLASKAQFLFSFHIGNEEIHLDNFLEHSVDIKFYFFEVKKITKILEKLGFEIIDVVERQPYEGVEHLSKRAYIWTRKS